MKVALFEQDGGRPGIGMVDGDSIIDFTDWVGPPQGCTMAAFLDRWGKGDPVPNDGKRIQLADVILLPPSLGSRAVICVGVNYSDHAQLVAERTGTAVSTRETMPALFLKVWSSLTGHLQPIVRPRVSSWLDFEGELAVIIGKHCRAVSRENALGVVAGYAVGQDGSVRDWQRQSPTPTAGKNFFHSGSLGPWMVTADEVPDPADLRITTTLNGHVMQDSPTSVLIHDVPALIEHITTFIPLAPGDVIFTGTPAGSFADCSNDQWLEPGDVVSVTISSIGTVTNHVIEET
ncbi:fumarylacetoacetate hydrolase family protein [Rhodococcus sp. LB1]|uniref:fumarylacetoacetate hydrolase family protein n=1 Tax=Rhodococcus sp. LB1 TaxID=1807499 RepID=UPI0007C786AA|nr:fumarylacetoacetate hydrolase family protein [Rhodococcus sp. LB1]